MLPTTTAPPPPFQLPRFTPPVPPCHGCEKSLCPYPSVPIMRHCVCAHSGPTTLKHPRAPLCAPKECAVHVSNFD